jgi:O-6-methylguanine DNA methyltransferase
MKPARRRGDAPASILTIKTTWGEIRIAARDGRIASCELPNFQLLEMSGAQISRDWKKMSTTVANDFAIKVSNIANAVAPADRDVLERADRFVRDLFTRRKAKIPPLEFPEATEFTKAVWKILTEIPVGKTMSYGAVATAARRPRAARAAGTACGANQIPLFIPCHRVLGAGGALGGFSSGLAWKKLLLQREGVLP